jgi:hypothetical protein
MTIQTLDRNESAMATEEAATRLPGQKAGKQKGARAPSSPAAALRRVASAKVSEGLPIMIWVGFYRTVVLLADYLLSATTAMVVIPLLAVWLHQQSGAASGDLTPAGTIAMWIAPLLFAVLILAAGEIAAMRAMWRWSSRRAQAVRDARVTVRSQSVVPAKTRSTNRKRSK